MPHDNISAWEQCFSGIQLFELGGPIAMQSSTGLRVVSIAAFLIQAVYARVAESAQASAKPVICVPFASSLEAEGTSLSFGRKSEATYFDIKSTRIVTVPAGEPRFVPAPPKPWGAARGLLLEVQATNLLLNSSFEGEPAPWRFTGKVEKAKDAGIHGDCALSVTGRATLTHKPISLKTPPSHNQYILSIYVRRRDGGTMSKNEVQCVAESENDKNPWTRQYPCERLGDGPWYRFCSTFRTTGFGATPYSCSFKFARGEYIADGAQLEYEYARSGGPSSYVPSIEGSAKRSPEILCCSAKELFPSANWSCSFWSYAYPNTRRNEFLFALQDNKGKILIAERRGTLGVAGKKVAADRVRSEGWTFITLTFDAGKLDYFIDGVSDHSLDGPFEIGLSRQDFAKAVWAGGGWAAPMGLIADFTTWPRALSPDEVLALYRTGVPCRGSVREAQKSGLPVAFKTGQSGKVSVNIYDTKGKLIYPLGAGKKLKAGKHILYWDGCDDKGDPAPPGLYRFKGLVSNVRSVWDGKVGNSSPSPGYGHLQYRTGHYSDVVALPDGGLVTFSFWGEASQVIQRIDPGKDYPVRWSSSYDSPWPGYCVAGAADDQYVYAVFYRPVGGKKDQSFYDVLTQWFLKTGIRVNKTELALNKPHKASKPSVPMPGHVDDYRNPVPAAGVCGIACHSGVLYIPFLLENRIALYDTKTLKEVSSISCPAPRRIAVDKKGAIYVTSVDKVLRIDPDGAKATPVVEGLDCPWGIAIGPDENVYVTQSGNTHQLKVFSSQGKLLRTFGHKGGHRSGLVRPDLLEMPLGVAVAPTGEIFISDLGDSRVLALNSDFSLRKVIHGRMPQFNGIVSDLDPSLFYSTFGHWDIWEYKVDYAAKTSEVHRRWNLIRQEPRIEFLGYAHLYFRKWGGRMFAVNPAFGWVAEIVGEKIVPRARLIVGRWDRRTKTYGKASVWRDRNMDGRMQKEEHETGNWPSASNYHDGYLDKDGNMFIPNQRMGILKVPFQGLDQNGIPLYHWSSARWVLKLTGKDKEPGTDRKLYPFEPSTYIEDQEGNFYVTDCGNIWATPKDFSVRKYSPNGELLWKVGRRQRGTIQKPGEMVYCGFASGLVDDRYLFYVDYYGQMNCWDTDGLWVGRLFSDLPEEYQNRGEAFTGWVMRHPNGKVYAFSSPDCTYRTSRIIVDGLEKIERFEGELQVKTAATRRPIADEELPPWAILRTRGPIRIDGEIGVYEWGTNTDTQAPVDFERNEIKVARAWAQWDDEALYLAWDIKDDSPAVNNVRGKERWGSDQVELMIRAQPGTESKSERGQHTATEYQIEIGPDGDGRVDAYVILNGSDRKDKFLPGVNVKLRVKEDKAGYTMEAAIPWASLGDYRPKKGDRILWNMKIHWGIPEGTAVAFFCQWAPGHHSSPKTWGVAVFD